MSDEDPSANDRTVHRTGAPQSQGADEVQGSNGDSSRSDHPSRTTGSFDGLEEAKTVIRHPEESPAPGVNPGRQTPAEVAGVLVDRHLNQYHLLDLIGGGGMGAVFRAHDEQLDRIVALKVIPFVGRDAELQRRFRNEAQNAAKLDHPRIARIFDAGSHDEWHYIVFEYIQGTNLRSYVNQNGVLSLDDAVFYTSQVAEALDHASQRGIVHRDIKPSNVLIADGGTVKLVDMGLARSDNLDLSEDMTASGVTLGTFDYISPEQALDPRDADLRSDLYSLGCTMYFMLTGEAPYTGGTMLQKLLSHGNAPSPDPREIRPDLPEEAVAVMHRMMAKDPRERYQNARDLLADLNELAFRFRLKRSLATGVVAVPTPDDGLQRLQFHVPWMIALTIVLLVAGYLQLQHTVTNDSFSIVQRPASLIRSGNVPLRSGPDSSADVDSPDNPDLSSGGVGAMELPRLDVKGPDGSVDLSSQGPGEMLPTSIDGPGGLFDSEATSEFAVKPPSLIGPVPFPQEMDTGTYEPDSLPGNTPGTTSAREPGILPERTEPMTRASDTPGDDSPSVNPETETQTRLPPPDSVRIVSPSMYATQMRVDQVARTADGVVLATGLSEAVDLAMRFGVLRIEFDVPEVVSGPFRVPSDDMFFTSNVGRTSIRLVTPNTLSIGRSDMIDLGNKTAQFSNIDFHWELADDQIDGGSMFVLNDNRFVRFRDCTFTLKNDAMYEQVTFFRVVTDPEAVPDSDTLPGRIFNPNENELPLVAVQLDNAVVRGEATFLEMDYAAELQLVWNNGLLAISGRMIETAGARKQPPIASSPIQISLSNLTAKISKGFLGVRFEENGEFPVPIERVANQCVFIVDEGQPHVQIIGVASLNPQRPMLTLSGNRNAYQVASTLSDAMLYIRDLANETYRVTMSQLKSEPFSWFQETSSRWTVYWSNPLDLRAMDHAVDLSDFYQDGVVFGGFEESRLPKIP